MPKKKWAGTDRHQPKAFCSTNHSIRAHLLIAGAALIAWMWAAGVRS